MTDDSYSIYYSYQEHSLQIQGTNKRGEMECRNNMAPGAGGQRYLYELFAGKARAHLYVE